MSSISEPSAITGLPVAPGGHERRRNSGEVALDFEAFFLQNAGQILRGFELLEAQFAEAEDAIDHHLRLLLHAVDLPARSALMAASLSALGLACGNAQTPLNSASSIATFFIG